MYFCGYRDLAQRLFGADFGVARDLGFADGDAPSFALPGDAPHYAPDRPADVRHIDLDVTLDFERASLRGDVTTHFTTLFEETAEVVFDAADLQIEAITLAGTGTALRHWSAGEKLHVQLDRTYGHGEQFAVRIRYSVTPRTGLVFIKPTEGDPQLPTQVWTQGETEYSHFWFPCHDFPNDRATTTLRATAPANFMAISNGALEGVQENADGTKTTTWRMDSPYPAYLLTLVVGAFSELPDHWRTVPVNYYVQPGREDDGRRMMGKTPRMIEYYSERFGVDYPYPKYAQTVAEQFLGAMENASATTHTYRLLADARASLDFSPEPVVAHELVHQWHGDMLAVRDWAHTWLKESFATYFEATWMQHDRGEDEFRAELRQNLENYLAADARGRRPVVYNVYDKNGSELFDRHVYEKGSLILHMLRNVLGDAAFWRGMRLYTQRNREREVITADFERALEEATGRSLGRFFEQWLYQAGHPEFTVRYAWDEAQKLAKLTVAQTQKTDARTPVFVTPVDVAFLTPERDDASADDPAVAFSAQTFRVTVDEANQTFFFPLPRRPFAVRFDQGGWLIKTLDFERPAELLRFQLRHDSDPLGRIEAAEALGKQSDPQSIAALEDALFAESFWAVRAAIAEALTNHKTERTLDTLLRALREIDEPKARRAVVAALGVFRAPERQALADRAAAALTDLLQRGDPSYFVEAAASTALGKTRAAGAFDTLVKRIELPSWNETLRSGAFQGLGELGDPRAVETLTTFLTDQTKPIDARAAAVGGLRTLAATRRIDPGASQTVAVEALIAALGDYRAERPESAFAVSALIALGEWGDQRAIPAVRLVADSSVEGRAVRIARETLLKLQRGRAPGEESRGLRGDLETLRTENATLRDRVQALEARFSQQASAQ